MDPQPPIIPPTGPGKSEGEQTMPLIATQKNSGFRIGRIKYFSLTGLALILLFIIVLLIMIVFVRAFSFLRQTSMKAAENQARQYEKLIYGARVEFSTGMNSKEIEGVETELTAGDLLKQGSELKTGKGGGIILVFGTGSTLAVGELSSLVLIKVEPEEVIVSQITGEAFYQTTKTSDILIVKAQDVVIESPASATFIVSKKAVTVVEVVEHSVYVKLQKEKTSLSAGQRWQDGIVLDAKANHILTATEFLNRNGNSTFEVLADPKSSEPTEIQGRREY